jgi:hypothetical protein
MKRIIGLEIVIFVVIPLLTGWVPAVAAGTETGLGFDLESCEGGRLETSGPEPPPWALRGGGERARGEVEVVDDGAWVVESEASGEGWGEVAGEEGVGEVEAGSAADWVVCVAGDEVDESAAKEFVGCLFCGRPEAAGEAEGGDLEVVAIVDHSGEAVDVLAEGAIAFGVSEDEAEASVAELSEDVFGVARHDDVAEFDEEPAAAVDGEGGWIVESGADVFVGEMEVAAAVDGEACGSALAELGEEIGIARGVEGKLGIGVRSGDDAGGAAGGGNLEHFETDVERGRSVIDAGQDVAVKIDHDFSLGDSRGG